MSRRLRPVLGRGDLLLLIMLVLVLVTPLSLLIWVWRLAKWWQRVKPY